MKHDAYWISKNGDIIPIAGNADRHIHMIIQNPEKFGFTEKQIKDIYKKRKEPLGAEANAREDIMIDLMERGWIRVRYVKGFDMFTIQLKKLDQRSKDNIWNWASGITNGKIDKVPRYSGIKIMDLGANIIAEGTLGDVLKYSGIFADESMGENAKIKRVFINKYVTIEDYNPKAHEIFIDNLMNK
jgi:hypothetical protein